jgi:prolipoprotein diacylglyceryltransferase
MMSMLHRVPNACDLLGNEASLQLLLANVWECAMCESMVHSATYHHVLINAEALKSALTMPSYPVHNSFLYSTLFHLICVFAITVSIIIYIHPLPLHYPHTSSFSLYIEMVCCIRLFTSQIVEMTLVF